MRSEEDVDLSDDEDGRDSGALGNDDSLDRSVTDRSVRSMAVDRIITKVSSTRKINDQGGEGFSPLKENSLKKYSRNETFAAGSRAYLHSSGNLSKGSLNSSVKHNDSSSDLRSENYLAVGASVSFDLSRTEAEHILSSGLLLSANALSWLTTLCKDVSTLMCSPERSQTHSPSGTRKSMEGLFHVLKWRLDNTITPIEFS